jgi:Ser/Thr protein kinase RdoA (MazF antagonist)
MTSSPTQSPTQSSIQSLIPFEQLTPDTVVDALASLGLFGDGRLMSLNSYENRVYLAHLETERPGHHDPANPADPTDLADPAPEAVVLKFYRPGRWTTAQILEEHTFAAELQAAEVPVVAPLVLGGKTLHRFGDFDFSVSPRRGGRRPELDDLEVLEWIGRFVARLHTVGAAQPFAHRPALNVASFATEPAGWLIDHDIIPLDVQSAWQEAYSGAVKIIANYDIDTADRGVQTSNKVKNIRLHGDCHPGNILWTPTDQRGGGPHFVDLDDARTGPAVQDLWMLLSGDRRDQTLQLSALLDGYEQVRDFNRHELTLIEPLRTLRLIHYSAWLARRWEDPIFPVNFPWFGTSDYWRGQVHMLVAQTEAMQEPVLGV